MRFSAGKLTIILHFTCCWLAVSCQSSTHPPIDAWIKDLSVKEDIRSVKLRAAHDQLAQIDSTTRCQVLSDLNKRSQHRNIRLQIRVALLTSMSICQDLLKSTEILEDALRKAYEIEDDLLSAELNRMLGNVNFGRRELGLAVMHKYKAYDIRKRTGEHLFHEVTYDLLLLGNFLYKARDYRESARITIEALRLQSDPETNPLDTLNPYWHMNAWNNLGLSYERLEVYDSAMIAFDKAYQLAEDPFWSGLIKGNRGDVFFLQGRYDSAEALLKFDYEQSLAVKEYDNASLSLQRLARIHNARGEHRRALSMLKEADVLEQRRKHPDYRAQILFAYATVYRDLNMADSTYYYMQLYQEITDTLETLAANNRTEVAELRMQNQDNVYRILELNKDKRRITLIRNFTIVLILVSAILGIVYTNRLRLKARLRQHEALEAKRIAEADAEQARKQLSDFTESLRKKTKQIEEMQSNMEKRELNQEQSLQIQKLTEATILTDADWEEFKLLFTRVYPGFFVDLKRKVTDITLAEQRMAALIKLQVSNKDATHMLGVSLNSIHKTRQRLRHRLGFENDTDLENYLTATYG